MEFPPPFFDHFETFWSLDPRRECRLSDKRKLNSIPEVLATFAEISLNQEWQGQRDTHLTLEEALEESNIKRKGERRDQTGGGARTYQAWVASLGLIFTQESTKQLKLTLAGEAIMNGDSPVTVLKNQVLKYQFPSSFSTSRGVDVSRRFKIRPFRFLLRLLMERGWISFGRRNRQGCYYECGERNRGLLSCCCRKIARFQK